MGYCTPRKEEVGMMPYQVYAKAFCIEEDESEVDHIKKLTSEMTKHILGLVDKEEFIDDVEYNQKWWKWYCQENKLDINTGKSLGSKFLYTNPLF